VLALAPPAPNPAHGRATLRFTLPAEAAVTLELLDVRGRRVWSRHGTLGAGTHAWDWDGRDAEGRPSGAGLYLVRLGTPWGTRGARLVWTR
jgi:flagellar hook assembly protein FlgD